MARGEGLQCPRCNSTNTRFSYYQNNVKKHPRHMCKNCERTWRVGGIVRNIPLGGGDIRLSRAIDVLPPCPHCRSSNTESCYLCNDCKRCWAKVTPVDGVRVPPPGEAPVESLTLPESSQDPDLPLPAKLEMLVEKVMDGWEDLQDLDFKIRELTKEREMKAIEVSGLEKAAEQLENTIQAQEISKKMKKEKGTL